MLSRLLKTGAVVALSAMLGACGGGGGGGTNDQAGSNSGDGSGDGGGGANPPTFFVGGTVNGMAGLGLIVQNNGSADLAIDANRSFTFATPLPSGSAYQVTVKTNPFGQVCTVSNGSGNIGSAPVTDVVITCTTPNNGGGNGSPRFTVGGTVSGLSGSGLVLRNGADNIAVPAGSVSFVFPTTLAPSSAFNVVVAQQPSNPNQVCGLTAANGTITNTNVTTVSVTCTNVATQDGLSIERTTLTFAGEEGESVASQSVVGFVIGATEPVFLTVAHTSAAIQFVSFTLLSETSGRVDVTPRHTATLGPGTYSDTISIFACFDRACLRPVTGSPKRVAVSYTVTRNPPPALLLSDHGVAFASVPGRAHLTRTLSVRDSTGTASTWSAVSDAPQWLSLTSSGPSGSSLTLSANLAGLAEGFYEARVTVTSSNPAIAQAQTVRVGLYVSRAASATQLAQLPPAVDPFGATVNNVVSDPIRPLVYSTSGSRISIDHVYTGGRVADIEVAGATLTEVVTSNDGSRLYALRTSPTYGIVVVDLDTRQVISSYGFPQFRFDGVAPLSPVRLSYARVSGRPVLILNTARIPFSSGAFRVTSPLVDADTGEMRGELFGAFFGDSALFAISRDGRVLYGVETGLSGILPVLRVELRVNAVGNIYGVKTAESPGFNESSAHEIAANADGSRVFVSFFTDNFIRALRFDGSALVESTGFPFFIPDNVVSLGATPRNVEIDSYGRIVTALGAFDFRLHASDETLIQQSMNLPAASIAAAPMGGLRISGDGLRAIGGGYLLDLLP